MPDEVEAAPKRAGRQPRTVTTEIPPGYVKVRVTKKGDKKIHAGGTARSLSDEHVIFDGDVQDIFPTYSYGDEIVLPHKIALAQEDNGYAEIQE